MKPFGIISNFLVCSAILAAFSASNVRADCIFTDVTVDFLPPWTTSGYGILVHTQLTGGSAANLGNGRVYDWDGVLLSAGKAHQGLGWNLGWNETPGWNETLELELKAEILTDPVHDNSPTIQLHASGSADDWIKFSGLTYGTSAIYLTPIYLYAEGDSNPVGKVTLSTQRFPTGVITWR